MNKFSLPLKPITLLLKPASGNCNMACKYCFYFDELKHNTFPKKSLMKIETFEILIQKLFIEGYTSISIIFQGGEPTLIGLDFFRKCVLVVSQYNKKNIPVQYSLQTNGLLITPDFAQFFAENNFLIGLSMDSNKKIHDSLRTKPNGDGTFNDVLHCAKLFDTYKVEYNILTVVTPAVVKNIKDMYEFYDRHNFRFQQYIPCIDSISCARGSDTWSLSPALYGVFLKKLFDFWYRSLKRGKPVYIRYFENIIAILLGKFPDSCVMRGKCSKQYVVEADGSVYPCDFYVLPDYCIGNVLQDSFLDIDKNRDNIHFIENSEYVHDDCRNCQWFKLCRGGCRRDRENFSTNKLDKNYFCESYIDFFHYAINDLQEIAMSIGNL